LRFAARLLFGRCRLALCWSLGFILRLTRWLSVAIQFVLLAWAHWLHSRRRSANPWSPTSYIGRKLFCEESIHHRILDLVCVGHRGALVNPDDPFNLITNPANHSISDVRLYQVLEPRRAILVGVSLFERRRPYVNSQLSVVARNIPLDDRVEQVAIEELEIRPELDTTRVEPWIGRVECELLRIERRHVGVEAAGVKRLAQAQARSDRYSRNRCKRRGNLRLEIEPLNRSRGDKHKVWVDGFLFLERADARVKRKINRRVIEDAPGIDGNVNLRRLANLDVEICSQAWSLRIATRCEQRRGFIRRQKVEAKSI